MTAPLLITRLKEGLSVGLDFTTAIGNLGVQANFDPLATIFDLDQLNIYER